MLAGVRPKKIAIASPSGQKATSPIDISALESGSNGEWKGASKYTSSPHLFAFELNGRLATRADSVGVPSDLNDTFTDGPFSNWMTILATNRTDPESASPGISLTARYFLDSFARKFMGSDNIRQHEPIKEGIVWHHRN